MNSIIYESNSEVDTKSLAVILAQSLKPPTIITLEGDLGMGKTTFSSSFINALSAPNTIYVQSPTYAISQTYNTSPPVTHIDLYRFTDSENDSLHLEDIGILDLIEDTNSFKLIEWPLASIKNISKQHVRIVFESARDETRIIEIYFSDDYSSEFIQSIKNRLNHTGLSIK